jgi:hypothetical protein
MPGTRICRAKIAVLCPSLVNGATYRWSVSASNSAGSSVPSVVEYFSVKVVPPLLPPTNCSPGEPTAPGATVTTLTPTLTWSASPSPTVNGYILSLFLQPGTIVLQTNVAPNHMSTTQSFVCPTLTNGATYAWQVIAEAAPNLSAAAPAVFFTVNLANAPPPPTGLTPGESSQPGATVTTLTPTLTWDTSPGASEYSISVTQVGSATPVVNLSNVPTTSIVCPPLSNGATYQWVVVAYDSAGSSAPSSVVYFTVQAP